MNAPCAVDAESWPPDYVTVWSWRQQQITRMRQDPVLLRGALEYYAKPENAAAFILHWCDTYDPRNAGSAIPAKMPFIMFQRQVDLLHFLTALVQKQENGLVEKARDMGATWLCAGFSVWVWLFLRDASVGWGSRKEALVDKLGDMDSIFEKMRFLLRNLPPEFMPDGYREKEHAPFMRLLNPVNGASITGEAGDNIGRGGRKLLYFKDESAHYERPELIEASLMDNTRVQVDISSVNGVGNVFYRKRQAGVVWEGGALVAGRTNVFVMDWRHHPAKDQAWYDAREARARGDGLLHLFRQEVDRKYEASVQGIIIPHEYVEAAIDAHLKLGFTATGRVVAGLDVADEGLDQNSLAVRKGAVLLETEAWEQGDTGDTTRTAVGTMALYGDAEVQYDCIGVGAGVKAEYNRLVETNAIRPGLRLVPWSAAAKVLEPKKHLLRLPNGLPDTKSPTNEDYYQNLKAQGWWELRMRFERTYNAIKKGHQYHPDQLISLPSDLHGLEQLKAELSQATIKYSTSTLKMMVDKKPDGTKSPNRADAVVQAYWPVPGVEPTEAGVFLRTRVA